MASYKKTDLPAILTKARAKLGDNVVAKQLYEYLIKEGVPAGWVLTPQRRTGRGMYSLLSDVTNITASAPAKRAAAPKKTSAKETGLSSMIPSAPPAEPEYSAAAVQSNVIPLAAARSLRMQLDSLVPDKNPTYVPFGHFRDVLMIIESRIFYPVFITGLSGNGKSVMVEQACAKLARNYIRVNITEETDEDDLIGGNTLVDGNVVYREGPVLTAMRTGSILLLDEVDLNATKILCLQSIMEGKPYFNKKTGETIYPQPGFNIIATANTKGRGSDTGRFIGTKMMNEAFLERFPITFEQEYPAPSVEKKILNKNFELLGCDDTSAIQFAENLSKWAEVIRKAYADQAVDDVISTRRLVAIVQAYAIFKDRMKAITLCLARFDSTTKEIFTDLYSKIDQEVTRAAPVVNSDEDINF